MPSYATGAPALSVLYHTPQGFVILYSSIIIACYGTYTLLTFCKCDSTALVILTAVKSDKPLRYIVACVGGYRIILAIVPETSSAKSGPSSIGIVFLAEVEDRKHCPLAG